MVFEARMDARSSSFCSSRAVSALTDAFDTRPVATLSGFSFRLLTDG